MSAESENYITPIFPAEDEVEEEETLNVQEGGAPSVEPKVFLNKYGAKLLAMFQNGYSTTFSKVLPPIDSILKFNEDGSVIEMKSIADMQTNKVDKAFQNFPTLVLYQFLQKVALYQSVGAAAKPEYDVNKHIALIEISVRLYILSYFLAMKNDTVALKDQFTDLSKKYFDTKEVSTYHSYFVELKDVLPKFQKGLFNTIESDNTDLDIITNILTHYGVVYFKLGNTYTKLEKKKILETENLYFYNTMDEMLDDLIVKIPEPPAPVAPVAPAPVVVADQAAAEQQAAAPVVGDDAAAPAAPAAPGGEGNLRGGSRKNRRSHRRNTSRKNRED